MVELARYFMIGTFCCCLQIFVYM